MKHNIILKGEVYNGEECMGENLYKKYVDSGLDPLIFAQIETDGNWDDYKERKESLPQWLKDIVEPENEENLTPGMDYLYIQASQEYCLEYLTRLLHHIGVVDLIPNHLGGDDESFDYRPNAVDLCERFCQQYYKQTKDTTIIKLFDQMIDNINNHYEKYAVSTGWGEWPDEEISYTHIQIEED